MVRLPDSIKACLLDMDGVLTDTASTHASAWKQTFDELLARHPGQAPFNLDSDYKAYVDGKTRYDGVRSFLTSRGIELPAGTADDSPEAETVAGVGNRKNELVQRLIADDGVVVYDGSVRFVEAARGAGLKTAVVSSSANTAQILDAAGITDLFDARVDGVVIAEERLHGKPAPDSFLRGAELLGISADAGAVFEDALAGVEAGRAGNFGLVVGVDRRGEPAGADRARRRHRRERPRGAGRMTPEPRHPVEPWALVEEGVDIERLAQAESLFALSNGHIGLRGNLDEGEPAAHERHLPQRLLRVLPARVRRARLRLRGGRPVDRQRDRRQDHPPPGRGRAARRAPRRGDPPRAQARLPLRACSSASSTGGPLRVTR